MKQDNKNYKVTLLGGFCPHCKRETGCIAQDFQGTNAPGRLIEKLVVDRSIDTDEALQLAALNELDRMK